MTQLELENARLGLPRAVAAVLPKVISKALGKQGFAVAAIISEWAEIVGEKLADDVTPQRISYPQDHSGGTLHVRSTSAMATEIQHLEPRILERINGYFGFQAVTRLKIHHSSRPKPEPEPAVEASEASEAQLPQAIDSQIAHIEDPAIRDALRSLGRAFHARLKPSPGTKAEVPRRS